MYAQVKKPKENSFPTKRHESRAVANSVSQNKSDTNQGFGFVDNRPEAIAQRKLKKMANNRPMTNQKAMQKSGADKSIEFGVGRIIQRLITNPNYNAPNATSVDVQAPLANGQSPAAVSPPGWCLAADAVNNPNNFGQTKPHHHERGHLIGRQFGGIGGATNLVTLTAKTNGFDMLAEENAIAVIINANPANVYTYTVTPVYNAGFSYSHLGNVDPAMQNHVYCRNPAPEFIDMDLSPAAGGASVHNVRVDNAEMYAQHLY
ncbi:MAG: hypothetical protein GQ564_22605 [Bacteroidales bacterium]|nr:hypothetical protein [Bacteroidales bacterium]